MTRHAVVIAGGGPTGLMLAGELALAGVDVERRESQDLAGLRAGGLHSRTIEVLDQRGIADRFVSQGQAIPSAPFTRITLNLSDLPTRHNYFLALWQTRIERILADWVGELAVPIYWGRDVTGFTQDDTGINVELSDGRSLRAKYLVGWKPTMPSGTQSAPECCATPWRLPRWNAMTIVTRPCAK